MLWEIGSGEKNWLSVRVYGFSSGLTIQSINRYYITSPVPPKIISDAAAREEPGNQVTCSATGTPPIYIAFIRNRAVLMNTTKTASSKLYQEGSYTCVATSKYGTDVTHFVIKGGNIKEDYLVLGQGIRFPVWPYHSINTLILQNSVTEFKHYFTSAPQDCFRCCGESRAR